MDAEIHEYYVTFGVQFSKHPGADVHPLGMVKDGYAVIEAPDMDVARKIANAIFGTLYAFIRDKEEFIDGGIAARWHHDGELMRIAWVGKRRINEPDNPPSFEKSHQLIVDLMEGTDAAGFVDRVAQIHFMQANVIRGERFEREQAEAELRDRELHHFEVEQELAELRGRLEGAASYADSLEGNWESGDLAGTVNATVFYLRGLGEAANHE
jgi:hypothetical protein